MFTHLACLRTSSLKILAFSHILTAAFGTSAEGTFYDLVQEDEDSEGRGLGNRLSPAGGMEVGWTRWRIVIEAEATAAEGASQEGGVLRTHEQSYHWRT